MELSVDNTEELDTWKASFLRAGVYPEREQRQEDSQVETRFVDEVFCNLKFILLGHSRSRSGRSSHGTTSRNNQQISHILYANHRENDTRLHSKNDYVLYRSKCTRENENNFLHHIEIASIHSSCKSSFQKSY